MKIEGDRKMLDNEKISRLTEKERALLDFSYNAEIGDVFIYASANSHKTTSIMRLAYDFYNAGLIHLV